MSAVAVVAGIAGWYVYDAMMAPGWMRDFGLDISARANVVTVSSGETAFSTMQGREDPDSPYICFSHSADFAWDRVYFVPSGGPIQNGLAALSWPKGTIEDINTRMANDSRYQLIAIERDGTVVDHGYYFTMWSDLSELARANGFSRSEAVFTAESNGETFTVKPAEIGDEIPCT